MKQYYLTVKQVLAEPYVKDGVEGYQVIYPDGYTSWCPKATFEQYSLPMGDDPTRITEETVRSMVVDMDTERMGNHTVLHTTLSNGFSLVTESACVEAANYDEEIGANYAYARALPEIWKLLGFVLASARTGLRGLVRENDA